MIEMDISDVQSFTKKVLSAFDAVPGDVFAIVQGGAAELVSNDTYQNRTGDLRSSTRAVNVNFDVDSWHFELEMDQEYASNVNDKGFSNIDEVGLRVEEEIDFFLGTTLLGRVLGGL